MEAGREILAGRGVIPLERMQRVCEGMTKVHVLGLLGQPKFKKRPGIDTSPSALRQIGSIFEFDVERDLSAVWIYVHDKRGTFDLTRLVVTFVGFRRTTVLGLSLGPSVVSGVWQESQPFQS